MSKIRLEIFDREVEILSYEHRAGESLLIEFANNIEGYVLLGGHIARVENGQCSLKTDWLEYGEHTPRLVLQEVTLDLPRLIKKGDSVFLSVHGPEDIGDLFIREQRLRRRVDEQEKMLKEISKRVFGTTIF